MAVTYEIDDNNVIIIDVNGAKVRQSSWPNGTAWASKAEAENWAKAYVAAATDDAAPRPGNSPEAATIAVEDLELSQEERDALVAEAEASLAAAEEAAKEIPVDYSLLAGTDSDAIIDAEVVEED